MIGAAGIVLIPFLFVQRAKPQNKVKHALPIVIVLPNAGRFAIPNLMVLQRIALLSRPMAASARARTVPLTSLVILTPPNAPMDVPAGLQPTSLVGATQLS